MRYFGNKLGCIGSHCFQDIEKPGKGVNFTLSFYGTPKVFELLLVGFLLL
jgi:hypothetical protein